MEFTDIVYIVLGH